MPAELKKVTMRAGSTETFKFTVYDSITDKKVLDLSEYMLKLFITEKDEALTIVKGYEGMFNEEQGVFDVLVSTESSKNFPNGFYNWVVGLRYPNEEVKWYFGELVVESGMITQWI